MKCEDIKACLPDFLTGELSPKAKAAAEAHLAACPACADELRQVTEMWTKLGVLPSEQPSPAVRDRFYTMLEAYKQGLEAQPEAGIGRMRRRLANLRGFFSFERPGFKFAAAAALLLAGVVGGAVFVSSGPFGARLGRLQREVEDMRQTTALSLLRQQSSSERILGVSYSERVRTPGPPTIEALLRTLDQDPSVNVRLAAADALYLFVDQPGVKEGLVASLGRQESPHVQVALIDLLVGAREKRAVEALKVLAANEKLDPGVRAKAESGVKELVL
jgi:hypothetical protein